MDRGEALRVFGLPASASEAQIKRAYRDLAKVWHPDRFANDTRLRTKAEETLKLINLAYRRLGEDATQSGSASTFFSRGTGPADSAPISGRRYRRRRQAGKDAPDAFARKFVVGLLGYLLLVAMVVGCLGSLVVAANSRRGIPDGMISWVLILLIAVFAIFGLTWRDYIKGIHGTSRFKNQS